MKLLVVDQEVAYRRMVAASLTACGHEVVQTSTGTEALEMLSRDRFDGVLTEMEVGRIDALQLADRVSRDPRLRNVGVILCTHPLEVYDMRGAMERGLRGYVTKPVDVATLGTEIENLLLGLASERSGEPARPAGGLAPQYELTLDVPIDPEDEGEGELEGEILDQKYEILDLIGRGGMSEVYEARHIYLDRPVAIKVLPRQEVPAPAPFTRFVQEARILARIRSPYIVSIHDFGFTAWQSPYLVMELLDGMTLAELLELHRPLPIADVEDIAIQATQGLRSVHTAGVLHLDLKPSNVMLAGDHLGMLQRPLEVRLLDFGISRYEEGDVAGPRQGRVLVTGTVAYMSPEQCRGETLGPASDLYSLGVVLYEALTGRTPFVGDQRADLVRQHLQARPQSPRVFNAEVPGYLEEVVLTLLAKDPAERFASAEQLMNLLLANTELSLEGTGEIDEHSLEDTMDTLWDEDRDGPLPDIRG